VAHNEVASSSDESSTNDDIVDAVIVPGKVTVTLPNAQISRLAGPLLDWILALTVDGSSKDACTETGFGMTTRHRDSFDVVTEFR
jgi:hypothetical protein